MSELTAEQSPTATRSESLSDTAHIAIYGEIACDALLAIQGARVFDAEPDVDALALQVEALRHVVARIGWIADTALERLGGISAVVNGGAKEWLLSPRAAEALEAING